MGMKAKDLSVRVGAQADRTTIAASFIDLAIPADGDQLVGNVETEALDTEHGARGFLYTVKNAKNDAEQGFSTFAFPVAMGTLMNNLFQRDSNGDQGYLSVEAWWGDAIGSGQHKGSRRRGVVLNSLSFSVDKAGRSQSVQFDFQGWTNRRTNIPTGEATPSRTYSTLLPWASAGVLVDFVADLSAESFGGSNADVRRFTVNFSNQGEVEGFEANAIIPELDAAWTIHTPGEETVEIEVTVALNDEKYQELDQDIDLPDGGLRVMFTHPKAATTTSTGTITAGDQGTQTLTVVDASSFEVGDVVGVFDGSLNWATLKIAAISGSDIDFDTAALASPVTLNGGGGTPLTVGNMAGGLNFNRMSWRGTSPPVRDGNRRAVTIRYEAALEAGAASPVEFAFYDHLTTHAAPNGAPA